MKHFSIEELIKIVKNRRDTLGLTQKVLHGFLGVN